MKKKAETTMTVGIILILLSYFLGAWRVNGVGPIWPTMLEGKEALIAGGIILILGIILKLLAAAFKEEK